MKRIGVLFLMIALLCGCGKFPASEAAFPPAQPLSARTAAPGPAVLTEENGLQRIPLDFSDSSGMYAMGEDLLIIRRTGDAVIFMRMSPVSGVCAATARVPMDAAAGLQSLEVWPEGLSFYHSGLRRYLVLDAALSLTRELEVPGDLVGSPCLSRDGELLFYCTADAVRCLDLESGISQVLKADTAPDKSLAGLLLEESVLRCRMGDKTVFLCAATGRSLKQWDGELTLTTQGRYYYAAFPNGPAVSYVYGEDPGVASQLVLQQTRGSCVFLPQTHGALTLMPAPENNALTLEYYDLDSGSRTGTLQLDTLLQPEHFTAVGNTVCFILYDSDLGRDTLCCWQPGQEERWEGTVAHPYFSREAPDEAGLAQCREQAQAIAERFGIRVLVWKDACEVTPWDYDLEPEHQTHIILRELEALEQRLGRYPEGFFDQLGQAADSITLCLVRSIRGTPESGSLDTVNGLQFWKGNDAYIAIAMGSGSETALYHELCHIIDTRVFSRSNAYDTWDSLNPGDFSYDYDYAANRTRESYEFLQPHSRSFVDMYSMSYPKEDRARIMECAMMPGNEELFNAPILQQKLLKLCTGIREAFCLEDYPQPLAWEAYLHTPLHPPTAQTAAEQTR